MNKNSSSTHAHDLHFCLVAKAVEDDRANGCGTKKSFAVRHTYSNKVGAVAKRIKFERVPINPDWDKPIWRPSPFISVPEDLVSLPFWRPISVHEDLVPIASTTPSASSGYYQSGY